MANQSDTIEVTETRIIRRVTLKGFVTSVLDAFNIERGGIYTLKRLFSNPGNMSLHYLGEGRFRYTAPFRMLILSTALALLVINTRNFTIEFLNGLGSANENFSDAYAEKVQLIFTQYLNLLLWIFIPVIAFFSWVFNRKSNYNYAENLVLHTNLMVISNLLVLLLLSEFFFNKYITIPCIYLVLSYSDVVKVPLI